MRNQILSSLLSLVQRISNCGVGLVADGLLEPCTCVWQFMQLRPCHSWTTFLPLVVLVISGWVWPGARV